MSEQIHPKEIYTKMTINEDKKIAAVEKIRKKLAGDDIELDTSLFIDAGIKGLRPQHMGRLTSNLDILEKWLHGQQHKHILNFFQHIDRLKAQKRKKEATEQQEILLLEQSQLQLDSLLDVAKNTAQLFQKSEAN